MLETNTATTGGTGSDHGLKGDVQRLGQYVGQLHDDLAGIAKGAGDVAQSGVAAALEGGKGALEAAKGKSEQATATLRDRIAKHPGATLGIAVGAGILIGLLGPAIVRSRSKPS